MIWNRQILPFPRRRVGGVIDYCLKSLTSLIPRVLEEDSHDVRVPAELSYVRDVGVRPVPALDLLENQNLKG